MQIYILNSDVYRKTFIVRVCVERIIESIFLSLEHCRWSAWSACYKNGTKTRSILVEAKYGGTQCEGPTEEQCKWDGEPGM